jgi:putative peptidoglycan lipid II flippase
VTSIDGAAATSDGSPPPPVDAPGIARSTLSMSVLTVVSRVTGFVRILVVASVLGPTFLGNTYQSSNSVPNILFELIAAGVLQAVLVPALVPHLDRGDQAEAEHVAGSVLGLACVAMAATALVGAVAAPWIARGLFSQSSPSVREDQIRLGTVFLWIFLPQVVMYVVSMVATSVLNARNRFALAVFAPVLNNVVVTTAYGLFWFLRDGKEPTLDLSVLEVATLAGGTTLGVLVFCSLPYIAVVRSGFSLRPRLDHRHPEVRRIGRRGLWAALFLAVTQLLLVVVLVLANDVEGGVVAYQLGFTFFLLPHSVIALPVLTALFPLLSRQVDAADWSGFVRSIERGVRSIVVFVVPAAAALMAMAPILTRSLLFGSFQDDAPAVARILIGFALGLPAYGLFLFLSRVMYARGDTRTPALVNLGLAVIGSVAMVVAFSLVTDRFRVASLAAVHSAAYTGGALYLYQLVRRGVPQGERPHIARPIATAVLAAVPAALVMRAVTEGLSPENRIVGVAAMAGALALGGIVYLAGSAALGGPRPNGLVGVLRGDEGG